MTTTMSAADIAVSRHLLGLSQAQLAEMLHVGRDAVKDWERGKFSPRPGVVADLQALLDAHDADVEALAAQDDPILIPQGPRPRAWYVGVAARLLLEGRRFEWDPVNLTALHRAGELLPTAPAEAVRDLAQWATDHRNQPIGVLVTVSGRIVAGTRLHSGVARPTVWYATESDLPDVAGQEVRRAMGAAKRATGEDIHHTTVWDLMP